MGSIVIVAVGLRRRTQFCHPAPKARVNPARYVQRNPNFVLVVVNVENGNF
jgi:hypothetical protein